MHRLILVTLTAGAIAVGLIGCDVSNQPVAEHHVDRAIALLKVCISTPSSFSLISGKEMWSGTNAVGNDAYIVGVEYDAQNVYGAMIRNSELIACYVEGKDVACAGILPISLGELRTLAGRIRPDETEIVKRFLKISFGQ